MEGHTRRYPMRSKSRAPQSPIHSCEGCVFYTQIYLGDVSCRCRFGTYLMKSKIWFLKKGLLKFHPHIASLSHAGLLSSSMAGLTDCREAAASTRRITLFTFAS